MRPDSLQEVAQGSNQHVLLRPGEPNLTMTPLHSLHPQFFKKNPLCLLLCFFQQLINEFPVCFCYTCMTWTEHGDFLSGDKIDIQDLGSSITFDEHSCCTVIGFSLFKENGIQNGEDPRYRSFQIPDRISIDLSDQASYLAKESHNTWNQPANQRDGGKLKPDHNTYFYCSFVVKL